jgi:hypothetical protein
MGVRRGDGIRDYRLERNEAFGAALPATGTNGFHLPNPARNRLEGLLYDCLRLVVEPDAST